MKIRLLLCVLCACVFTLSAEEMPADYYAAANGKSDASLKSTLRSIIRNHTVLSYGSGSNSSWYCFYYADRDTVTNLCMDMYSDDWKPFTSPGTVVSGCNVEHSFAKSWWGGTNNDAYKDCYHLNPSNSTANSSRSNYPLGIPTQDLKSNTGSLRVGKATYNSQTFWVFEPKDEYKGDFARAYFYMATCYGDELTWRKVNTDVGSYYAMRNPTDENEYLEFLDWEIEILLAWHRQDPVSSKEIHRADAVSNFQHNRNPFIDYPCLAEYIWGNHQGETVDFNRLKSSTESSFLDNEDRSGCDCEITVPTITAPRRNTAITIGTGYLNETYDTTIHIQGVLLTQTLSLTVSGTDADNFTLSVDTITVNQALAGVDVTVSYHPAALGHHQATLTIASNELVSPTTVTLTGKCIFAALAATNVNVNGFTANWTSAGVDNYVLDVYQKTVSGTSLDTLLYIEALSQSKINGNGYTILDGKSYDETNALRLGTGSGDGSIIISGLDMSSTARLTVTAKAYGTDNSTLKVSAGTSVIGTETLTDSFADYLFDITATSTEEVTITQGTSKQRVIISDILLTMGGSKAVTVSVDGYPKSVGNVLLYDVVVPINNNKAYFYMITPDNYSESNEIVVNSSVSGFIHTEISDVCYTLDGSLLRLWNLPLNAQISVLDAMGRVYAQQSTASQMSFSLPSLGIYLIIINDKTNRQVLKIVSF